MSDVPIGFQLFSVRGEVDRDLPATLEAVATLGYRGAEPWGYTGKSAEWKGFTLKELRSLYDDNGLACCGVHLAVGAVTSENLPQTIEFGQVMGCPFLIVASDRARMGSADGIAELADLLNAAAEAMAPHGLFTGYHAHDFDFATVDGEPAWNRLFDRAAPEVVMQLDVGNCLGGGGDPIAALRRYPERGRTLHLKDHGGGPGAALGEGEVDFAELFDVVTATQKPEWYVVEQGGVKGFGFDVPRRSLDALRRMGL